MPRYITKNSRDGNPYLWSVQELVPEKFGAFDYFAIDQKDQSYKFVGLIQAVAFTGLKQSSLSVTISFSSKRTTRQFIEYLENALKVPLEHELKDSSVAYKFPAHKITENLTALFSAMNLIERLPQDLILYISRYFGFHYIESIEKEILSDLYHGYKNGPMEESFFRRACILAKAANSPKLYEIIASACSRANLEEYALIAASDGLKLISEDKMAADETLQETMDSLNFRAGWALRHCTQEAILRVNKLCLQPKKPQESVSSSNKKDMKDSKDLKDVKEKSDIVVENGPQSLEFDDDNDEAHNNEKSNKDVANKNDSEEAYTLIHAPISIITVEDNKKFNLLMSWLAAEPLLKITNEKFKYYNEAQDLLSQIFAYAAKLGDHSPKDRLKIRGGDTITDTLMTIAAKMKEINIKLEEQTKLIEGNKDSKAASELLETYKKEKNELSEKLKAATDELYSSKGESNKHISILQSTLKNSIEKTDKLETEKANIAKKLEEITHQLITLDQSQAEQKELNERLVADTIPDSEGDLKKQVAALKTLLAQERKSHNATKLLLAAQSKDKSSNLSAVTDAAEVMATPSAASTTVSTTIITSASTAATSTATSAVVLLSSEAQQLTDIGHNILATQNLTENAPTAAASNASTITPIVRAAAK